MADSTRPPPASPPRPHPPSGGTPAEDAEVATGDELGRRFRASFREELDAAFPLALPDGLIPCLRGPDGRPCADLIGTPDAAARPPVRGEVDWVRRAAPGYLLVGFWGYGANSYAFYYAEATRRETVYLRLSFGGAYGDPAVQGRRVLGTLRAWGDLRGRLDELGVARIEVVAVPGDGWVTAEDARGEPLVLDHELVALVGR